MLPRARQAGARNESRLRCADDPNLTQALNANLPPLLRARSGRKLGLLIVISTGIAWLLLGHGRPGESIRLTWRSGAVAGYGPKADIAFGAWRGLPVRVATDYIGSDDWAQIEDPAWAISQWGGTRAVRPELSVAMWPATGGTLAQAASGAYNPHFAALARNLVAGGLGSVGIRLAWEFNTPFYRWAVRTPADALLFAQSWREIVEAMKSVPGAGFSFDWSPNMQRTGVDPALAYPGDHYVSEIGLDVYDWNQSARAESPARRWSEIVSGGYGLKWQSHLAAMHHKPVAFPEWGLVSYAADPRRAGGDDPAFIDHMFEWFANHDVAFECYFDADLPAAGFYSSMTSVPMRFPRAAARYRALYAQAARGNP